MFKIYTKNTYIRKLESDLFNMADEEPSEISMLSFYYDGLIESVQKKFIPIIIIWNN